MFLVALPRTEIDQLRGVRRVGQLTEGICFYWNGDHQGTATTTLNDPHLPHTSTMLAALWWLAGTLPHFLRNSFSTLLASMAFQISGQQTWKSEATPIFHPPIFHRFFLRPSPKQRLVEGAAPVFLKFFWPGS
jgi:hypothetical protein